MAEQIITSGQRVTDTTGDPYLRSLYFGTGTTPGFLNQLQQIARKRFATAVPEQQIAGLGELEQLGLSRLRGGIGDYERFLTAGEEQLSRIRDLQDPMAFQKYENPYQQAVIDQATQDAVRAFDMSENRRRFKDIQTGGESAFGSRARLGSQDRMEEFSRGLTKELAGLRAAGYRDSLDRVNREITDRRTLARDLSDLGSQTQSLGMTGIANLLSLGRTPRDLQDRRFQSQFNRQLLERNDPLATAATLSQIMPRYQPVSAQLETTYGRAPNPRAVGVGAFLNTFSNMMPNMQQSLNPYLARPYPVYAQPVQQTNQSNQNAGVQSPPSVYQDPNKQPEVITAALSTEPIYRPSGLTTNYGSPRAIYNPTPRQQFF